MSCSSFLHLVGSSSDCHVTTCYSIDIGGRGWNHIVQKGRWDQTHAYVPNEEDLQQASSFSAVEIGGGGNRSSVQGIDNFRL